MQGVKTGGRKSGIPNRITTKLKDELSEHLETYIETDFLEDWNELTPRERVRVALSISQLIIPKPLPEPVPIDDGKPSKIEVVIIDSKHNPLSWTSTEFTECLREAKQATFVRGHTSFI